MLNKNGIEVGFVKRGEIIWIDFPDSEEVDCRMKGKRPCLLISGDACNNNSGAITVAPITSSLNKKPLKTHVRLQVGEGVKKESLILCEQLTTVDKQMIISVNNGYVSEFTMKKVEKALMIQIGINLENLVEENKKEEALDADYDYINDLIDDIIESGRNLKQTNDSLYYRVYKTSLKSLEKYSEMYNIDYKSLLNNRLKEEKLKKIVNG